MPHTSTPPRIELQDVRAGYESVRALHGVSFTAEPGEFVAVVGPNGAGKSTLVKAISGVLPVEGQVRLGDRPLGQLSPRDLATLVSVVPQDTGVPFPYTVLEVVLMGRAPHLGALGVEGPDDLRLAREALERTGITNLEARSVTKLSGGERQRVALARALAQDTPVLLLDEPTAHLDLAHQVHALEIAGELHRQGKTVVAVLHDLNLAAWYCPRVILLAGGRVVADGAPTDVFTEDRLAEVYGLRVALGAHPHTGQLTVFPVPTTRA